MELTFFAPTLYLPMQLAKAHAIDPIPLLIKEGIDPSLISDYSVRISSKQGQDFLQKIADIVLPENPYFGLEVGDYWHPSQMGALGYAWMTSGTLRSAFNRYVRFSQTVLGTVNVSCHETKTELSLVFDFAQESFVPWFRQDANRSMILAMIRCNAGADFYPKTVRFKHDKPANTEQYEALFQCPVIFNADSDSLTISNIDADKPLPYSNKHLAYINDQVLVSYLATLKDANIVERVKSVIKKELCSGHLSEESTAKLLLMSNRTLQRRLEEENTTFKSLLTDVRQELAQIYLADNNLSLTEISFLLGFSESSSFSRAFKRWSGSSPSEFRAA